MIDLIFLYPLVIIIDSFRKVITADKYLFLIAGNRYLQRLVSRFGIIQAYRTYLKARKHCPAYGRFLQQCYPERLRFGRSLAELPETNKENYVKKYSIEERCYYGRIPAAGAVIDESSGSSGTPNNWVRGPNDRRDVKNLLQITFGLTYHKKDLFVINCFALGPWATGMNVSMALADVAILKSIGPDIEKLENTLRIFGPGYKYLIVGYPPFIKLFVNSTQIDFKDYEIHLITGGEGVSPGLRKYLSRYFKTLISSYGASDLDINIGFETELTIALHGICDHNPHLTKTLFGREQVPMIFQYNPLDYYIQPSAAGELIFTVNRLNSAAPKIRYNVQDMGGVIAYSDLIKRLKDYELETVLPAAKFCFPLLFVYGRGDSAVPFFGAKVFSSDLDSLINTVPQLNGFNSFRLSTFEDAKLNRFLKIALELKQDIPSHPASIDGLPVNHFFFNELQRVNQDFREVSKLFTPDNIIVEVFPFGTGVFRDRDIRIKQKYIDYP